jgi:organic radical activating enzyme
LNKIIGEVSKYPARHVVVTGGEPFWRRLKELTVARGGAANDHH